jgi:chromate transporter
MTAWRSSLCRSNRNTPEARNGETEALESSAARIPRGMGAIEVFLLVSKLGLLSFGGGVPAWMHQAFVSERGRLSETEFAAALALARIMPGVNVLNLAILVGYRSSGAAGAVAAAAGILVGPSLAIIGIATLYSRFAGISALHTVLEGIAVSAVGLLLGMGVKSGSRVLGGGSKSGCRITRSVGAIAMAGVTFVCIGVLRLPTAQSVFCLAPLSIALAYFTAEPSPRRERAERG